MFITTFFPNVVVHPADPIAGDGEQTRRLLFATVEQRLGPVETIEPPLTV